MLSFRSGSKGQSNKSNRDSDLPSLESASTNTSSTLPERPSALGESNPPTFSERAPPTGMSRYTLNSERIPFSRLYSTVCSGQQSSSPSDRSSLSTSSKYSLSGNTSQTDSSNIAINGTSTSSGISCPVSEKSHKKSKEWILELEVGDSDETDWELPWRESLREKSKKTKNFSCSHVHQLQKELDMTQNAFLTLSTQYTRMQFKLRQVIEADHFDRDRLLNELKGLAYSSEEDSELQALIQPKFKKQKTDMMDLHHRQSHIIGQLRSQLGKLQLLTYADNCSVHRMPDKSKKDIPEVIPMYEYYYVPEQAKKKTYQNQYTGKDAIKTRKFATMFEKLDNYP